MKKTGVIGTVPGALDLVILGLIGVILFVGGTIFGGATPQGKALSSKATSAYTNLVGK